MDNTSAEILKLMGGRRMVRSGSGDEMCVNVELGECSYRIDIALYQLDEIGRRLLKIHAPGKAAVITDRHVEKIYGDRVSTALRESGYEPVLVAVRPGEKSKNVRTATRLCGKLLDYGFDRGDLVVALGGGVVGDLAGFVAAVYMRGIDFVQVPTTLLAQVDSSIGGKVAVDHPECKNLIGAFHQPRYVLVDPSVLDTLDEREVRNGLAEMVKHTVLGDPDLFNRIAATPQLFVNAEAEVMVDAIRRSCEFKADVVTHDEQESGLRAILNLGHTAGHAIEAAAGYRDLRHGEAVAYGLIAACRLSERMGIAVEPVTEPVEQVLKALGMIGEMPIVLEDHTPATVLGLLRHDKKFRGGKMKFVLPERIGSVRIVENVPERFVREVLEGIIAGQGSD